MSGNIQFLEHKAGESQESKKISENACKTQSYWISYLNKTIFVTKTVPGFFKTQYDLFI